MSGLAFPDKGEAVLAAGHDLGGAIVAALDKGKRNVAGMAGPVVQDAHGLTGRCIVRKGQRREAFEEESG